MCLAQLVELCTPSHGAPSYHEEEGSKGWAVICVAARKRGLAPVAGHVREHVLPERRPDAPQLLRADTVNDRYKERQYKERLVMRIDLLGTLQ
jgi:hypothetical protein